MLVGWSDGGLRSACLDSERGRAIWGAAGWNLVQELLAIASDTDPLGELIRFASVDVSTAVFRATPVVVMRYRVAELLADPHRPDGPVALTQEDHDMRRVEDADRLLIRDVRCDRRSPLFGVAA
jgi:hypothetical protein